MACLGAGATLEMGTWEEEQVGGIYVGSGHAVKAKLMGLLGPGWKRNVQSVPGEPMGLPT